MKKIMSVCVLWCALTIGLRAQKAALDTVADKFSGYRENGLQEKIYAHLDRSFYLTGETLWFKVYAVDGSFHRPLGLSSVAYAEILDRADSPVLQAKIEMKDGQGSGSFFLPASLTSDNYKFRVYTNWMKNFDPEFYFHQMIAIVNPFLVPDAGPPSNAPPLSVDFFPEGGNLVAGIKSKVGFRISSGSRKSNARGFVLNDHQDTVAFFGPAKSGVGHFFITASENGQFKVILVDDHGGHRADTFPAAQPAGYAMQLTDSGRFLRVSVTTKKVEDDNLFLFVHARQIMEHAERQPLKNDHASFLVKKSELSGGISHFTIFNNQLQPVCERLYFVNPHKTLSISLESGEKTYRPRQKVSIGIQTNNEEGTPTAANLSVSVFKNDSLGTDPIGIYPYLWLAADLAGPIESPNYFFDETRADVSERMDDLMLTHGWRRFDWKDILGKQENPRFLPEVNGHIIKGTVSKDGHPRQGVFAYLGAPGRIIRAYGSWSKPSGEVQFEMKDFYGPRKIILQMQTDTTEACSIQIHNPFSTSTDKQKLEPLKLDESMKDALLSRSIAMQVQDIYYYDRYGNRFSQPVVDSTTFYGKADATYYLDDYTRFPVMEEVMREYVPGVFVRKRKDGFHFLVVNATGKGLLYGDPMVLLDGVPVLDVDDVMKLNPLRVKKLEVIQRQYFLGQAVFSGIVSYTTYDGDLGGLELDPKSVSLNYDGLQLRREFYSPRYTYRDRNDRLPDQRYLLFWNAEIATGADGKQNLEFYTSDIGGQYVVVVQGIDGEGFSGSKKYTFTVTPADDQ